MDGAADADYLPIARSHGGGAVDKDVSGMVTQPEGTGVEQPRAVGDRPLDSDDLVVVGAGVVGNLADRCRDRVAAASTGFVVPAGCGHHEGGKQKEDKKEKSLFHRKAYA